MNTSTEWADLMRVWQQDVDDGADMRGLRRRVQTESRWLSLSLLAEYAVGAVITCLVAWKLATDKGPDTFVWGFAMLWFTGMALQFTSDNRRGTWIPSAESTRAYLDLALERLSRRERSLRFAWLLYGLQVAFLVAWYPATWFLWPEQAWPLIERTPVLLAWLALTTLALVGWSVHVRARTNSERGDLERLREEFRVEP